MVSTLRFLIFALLLSWGFCYSQVYAQSPIAGTIAPTYALPGATITISGSNFTGTKSVVFSGVPAEFTVQSATSLAVIIPATAPSGPIRITNASGTVLTPAFKVLRNSNSNSFVSTTGFSYPPFTYNGGKSAINASPTFTDLDGDNLIDMLVGTDDGTLERYEQNTVKSLVFRQVTKALISSSGRGYFAPAVTDLNGDGLLDILMGDGLGFVSLYSQTSVDGTTFSQPVDLFGDLGRYAAPAVSDLDGDGLLDVLIGLYDGRLEHFEQTAANSLSFTRHTNASTSFSNINLAGNQGYAQPRILDVNGDGLLDLVVGHYDGNTDIFKQSAPNSLIFNNSGILIGDIGDHAAPAFSDLNGDGQLDVIMGEWKAALSYYSQAASPIAEVGVTLAAGTAPFAIGKTATFTVTLTNSGPNSASGITVSDLLDPAQFQIISSSDAAGYVPANRVWNAGSILSSTNNTTTKTLTITAKPLVAGPITIKAAQAHAEVDLAPNNDSQTLSIDVKPAADIEVKNTVSPTTYNNGDFITYTVTAKNLGPSAATNVVVQDKLPAALELQTPTPSDYDTSTGIWMVGSLAVNEIKTLTLLTKATKEGSFTTTASLADRGTNELDENTSNNVSSNTINVNPSADVSLTNTVSVSTPKQSSAITYTMVVANNGPNPGSNVVVTGAIPTGLTFNKLSASAGTATIGQSSVSWQVGNIASGSTQTLVLYATPTAAGTISFTGSLTHGENDKVPANNNATATINVEATADVAITNTVSAPSEGTYDNNEIITYTWEVKNNGPSEATSVEVTEVLPTSIEYIPLANSPFIYNSTTRTLSWAVGTLANQASFSLNFKAKIIHSAVITTSATVTHTQFDNVNGNNTATNSITSGSGTITADISVDLIPADAGLYYTGKDVPLTLKAANLGPDAANNIKLKVKIPSGLSLQSAITKIGSYNSADSTWTIPSLAANASGTSFTELALLVKPLANAATGSTAILSYTITGSLLSLNETETGTGSNVDSETIQVNKHAEVATSMTVTSNSPDGKFYHNKSLATFTMTATNNGPDVVTGLVGKDTQTGTITFTALPVASKGSYDPRPGNGLWTVGSLAPGETATLVVQGIPNTTGRLNLGGGIYAADQNDLNQENNQAITLLNVLPVADLAITNTAAVGTFYNGQETSFTVKVVNNGADAATGVVIEDKLPTGLSFVSATTSSGDYDPATGLWTLRSDVLPGAANAQTLIITAKPQSAAQYSTTASVLTSNQYDDVTSNNSQTVSVQAVAAADIQVTGTIVPGPYYVGGKYFVEITVTNLGPDAATGVVIASGVASGLILVPGSGAPSHGTSIDPQTGIWTIGNIPANESRTLTLLAQPTTFGILTSAAFKYAANEYDVNGENTRNGNNSVAITMEVFDQGATHQDFMNTQHFFSYKNNDVLAKITDPDGAIVSAVLAEGHSLPAGIGLSQSGILTITNKLLLHPGTFSATITTTDLNGGTTTQVLEFAMNDDWDYDGIADANDSDDNNDGISDVIAGVGIDPFGDLDGDGVLNYADSTNGSSTYSHPLYGVWRDTNADGINDWFDLDLDGMLNSLDVDMDGDGITNIVEANKGKLLSQDIYSHETGTMTGTVNVAGTPNSAVSNGTSIFAAAGTDGSLYTHYIDTDKDGYNDFLDIDADNDGIQDITEAQEATIGKAGYRNSSTADLNTNGLSDSFDLANGGGLSLVPVDTDQAFLNPDGVPDYLDTDTDNDLIKDFHEAYDLNHDGVSLDDYLVLAEKHRTASGTTFYSTIDTDGDGVPDWLEENLTGTPKFLDPSNATYYLDSNKDGLVDLFDANSFGTETVPAQAETASSPDYRNNTQLTPLPVTLLSFTAKAQQGGVELKWATASEKENEYFQVERSADGKTFQAIGKVAGAGNSSVRRDYGFLDGKAATGTTYYRLKQVDFNGSFEYSKTVAVETKARTAPVVVKAYPNPTSDIINLDLSQMSVSDVQITVYALNGRLVKTLTVTGGAVQKLDLTNVSVGTYLLKVRENDAVTVVRVVKQ